MERVVIRGYARIVAGQGVVDHMQYRNVPKNGDSLSVLGFGCMRFPQKRGGIDEEKATFLLRKAIDEGVNYIDTAWPYHGGASEPFVGRALLDGYREKVKLATKLPQWIVKTREDMDSFLNSQLERLQTDKIDYYLIHSVGYKDWQRLKEIGISEFLDTAKKDGRIVNAGFSYHEDTAGFKKIVDDYPWEFCQIQYNIMDEFCQAGREGLKYAAEKNLAVIIMEPLRGGKLSLHVPNEVSDIYNRSKTKRSSAEWAFRWLFDQPEVTVVLSGMNLESHLMENIRVAGETRPGSLTQEDKEILSNVSETYRRLMKVPCTGCQYCMPCPAGVNIPACFEIYNNYHMYPEKMSAKITYAGRLGGAMGSRCNASLCIKCGRCEKYCPQHIEVPLRLSEVSSEMEGILYHLIKITAPVLLPVYRWISLIRR